MSPIEHGTINEVSPGGQCHWNALCDNRNGKGN